MLLTAEFWQSEQRQLKAVLLPRLEQMAIAGANIALQRLAVAGIVFDNAQAHAAAVQWARAYTDELLMQLGSTTEKVVGEVLAGWIETPGATTGDLVNALMPVLDDNVTRAATIAVTESTRAFTQGELETYIEAGLPRTVIAPPDNDVNCRCWTRPVKLPNGEWVIVWQTERDSKVRTEPKSVPWGQVQGHRGLHDVVISEGQYLGMKLSEARRAA